MIEHDLQTIIKDQAKALAGHPEQVSALKGQITKLQTALKKERGYNQELKLKLKKYQGLPTLKGGLAND